MKNEKIIYIAIVFNLIMNVIIISFFLFILFTKSLIILSFFKESSLLIFGFILLFANITTDIFFKDLFLENNDQSYFIEINYKAKKKNNKALAFLIILIFIQFLGFLSFCNYAFALFGLIYGL